MQLFLRRTLLSFDRLYSEFTDLEKKKFLGSFVKDVLIHDNELEDGRFLKTIRFRFPVYYGGLETEEIDLDSSNFWDKETTRRFVCFPREMSSLKSCGLSSAWRIWTRTGSRRVQHITLYGIG